jgi:hypothetical protein
MHFLWWIMVALSKASQLNIPNNQHNSKIVHLLSPIETMTITEFLYLVGPTRCTNSVITVVSMGKEGELCCCVGYLEYLGFFEITLFIIPILSGRRLGVCLKFPKRHRKQFRVMVFVIWHFESS